MKRRSRMAAVVSGRTRGALYSQLTVEKVRSDPNRLGR